MVEPFQGSLIPFTRKKRITLLLDLCSKGSSSCTADVFESFTEVSDKDIINIVAEIILFKAMSNCGRNIQYGESLVTRAKAKLFFDVCRLFAGFFAFL